MEQNGEMDIGEELFETDEGLILPQTMLCVEIGGDFKLDKSFLQQGQEVTDENLSSLFPIDDETREMTADIFDTLLPPLLKQPEVPFAPSATYTEVPLPTSTPQKRALSDLQAREENKKARSSSSKAIASPQAAAEGQQDEAESNNSEIQKEEQRTNVVETRAVLTRRLLTGGTPKPKHVCSECGKVFKRAHNLKIHGRLHSGDKPYSCPFPECDKEFRWKSSIVSHMNWHRTKKGDVLPGQAGNTPVRKLLLKTGQADGASGSGGADKDGCQPGGKLESGEEDGQEEAAVEAVVQQGPTAVVRQEEAGMVEQEETGVATEEETGVVDEATGDSGIGPDDDTAGGSEEAAEENVRAGEDNGSGEVDVQQLMVEMTQLTGGEGAGSPSTTAESGGEQSGSLIGELLGGADGADGLDGLGLFDGRGLGESDAEEREGAGGGLLLPALSCCKFEGPGDPFAGWLGDAQI